MHLSKISVASVETDTPFDSQISSATVNKNQVSFNVIASSGIISLPACFSNNSLIGKNIRY